MHARSHRIGRLNLQIQAESPQRAFDIRERLNQSWEQLVDELLPDLDRLDQSGRWLRIPRLQFNIRIDDTQDLERRLPALLREALAEQWPGMESELNSAADTIRQTDTPLLPSDAGESGVFAKAVEPAPRQESPRVLQPPDLLEHYLLYGRLPWYAADGSGVEWQETFEALVEERFAELLPTLLEQPSAAPVLRFLNLLADAALLRLLEAWFALRQPAPRGRRLLLELLQADDVPIGSRQQRGWLVARLLKGLAGAADSNEEFIPVKATGWRIPTSYRLSSASWHVLLFRAGYDPPLLPVLADVAATDSADVPASEVSIATGEASPIAPTETMQPAEPPDLFQDNAFPVANAGLILLHPYLPRFFSACDIDLNVPEPARDVYDRAAAALYFLAAGDRDPIEFELGTIKLLLGLEPDHPLPVGAGLLDAAPKAEAESLLDSFIGHWSALKSTSRDGLREAFLQRPGLLKPTDDAWLLRVEPGGVDILLERLPFSYSVVNLPWMQKPIQVEW